MINLPTKFAVPNFTRYRNMKGVAKCRSGGSGSCKLIDNVTIQ